MGEDFPISGHHTVTARPANSNQRSWAWARLFLTAVSIIASLVLTYLFAHTLTNKPDVLAVVAAIFAILAGVLIVIISVLGDPSMLLDQSWRHSFISAQETQRKIHRQTDIFLIYIALLSSIFAYMITPEGSAAYSSLRAICFFLICLAFFASLSLPFVLRSIQKTRLERAIDHLKGAR